MTKFKPDNYPQLSPYMTVQDADESIAFYERAFGFKLDNEPVREGDAIMHAEMSLGEAKIMFAPEGAFGSPAKTPATTNVPSPIGLYIYVGDVDAFCQHAQQNGAQVAQEPTNMFWGDRMCRVIDQNGYQWTFATYISEKIEASN